MRFDWVIEGGIVVAPGGRRVADIGVAGGKIAAIGALDGALAEQRFDARGLHVLPGLIDSQVHFREPGGEHKEDLASGSRAAVLGCVTTVFEMPNTQPATVSAATLADKLSRAQGRMWCDHAFFMGATADNAEELVELERLAGCAGVKIFIGSSTGDLLVEEEDALRRILASGRRRVAAHCEDEERLRARKSIASDRADPSAHPLWRDEQAALIATRRFVRLARETGRPVHVLHVTTEEEMAFLAGAKDVATVEVTPQHLTLEAEDAYHRLGTCAQMNPPVRDRRHVEALWRALDQGLVDVIGSDHAPHTLAEKARPYPESPSGMPGVQTMLPIMLDHVARGRLSLERAVDLLCHGPARIFGLATKGRIALGMDADLAMVDLDARRTIERSWLASKCGWSPFEGKSVQGWPIATFLRGEPVMREGAIVADGPAGRPATFYSTLRSS